MLRLHHPPGAFLQTDVFDAMASQSDAAPARWRRPLSRFFDGAERGWAIPALIVAFAGLWFVFLKIAYLSGDLHVDALETWSLGRDFAWGNAKHPPLMGWVAWLWTLVFPLTDWSFQLLAMTNAAVALYAVDLIARRFMRGDKRVIVLLLLMLLPAYQFHAQRFNANTVLLAMWPLATWCFLRAYGSRQLGWSIAVGALTALAMLGKYYSIFLVLSFVVAAIAHPDRKAYFRSSSPWVSTLSGLVLLAPHIHWLIVTGAEAFDYALLVHAGNSMLAGLWDAAKFLAGVAASLVLAAIAWILIANLRLMQVVADIRALNSGLWLLALILIGTLVLPALTAIILGSDMPSLWALQGLFLIAIVLVGGARFPIARFHTVNLAVAVYAMAIAAIVIAAPIHAIIRNTDPDNDRAYFRIAALEITKIWRAAAGTPIASISGDERLAFATAFYSPDHPHFTRPYRLHNTQPVPPLWVLERGWAAMCFATDLNCMNWMDKVQQIAPGVIRSEFVAQRSLFGKPGVPARIATLIQLPEPRKARVPGLPGPVAVSDEIGASRR